MSGRDEGGAPGPVSREAFFASYCSDPTAAGFVAFLFGGEVPVPPDPDLSNANTASLVAFAAVQSGDANLFEAVHLEASRRSPKAGVPWLMNDPFLFGLVLGVRKFGLDGSWIAGTLRTRAESTTGEARETATTLLDVLSGNWANASNIRPLALVALSAVGQEEVSADLIDEAYRATTEARFPYSPSGFLNAVYLRAFDYVVLAKTPPNPRWERSVESLVGFLWKRAGAIAWMTWAVLLVSFCGLVVWIVVYVKSLPQGDVKDWVETLGTLGVPVVSVVPIGYWVNQRDRVVSAIRRYVLRHVFGLDPHVLGPESADHG